jgi:hypothetical protein
VSTDPQVCSTAVSPMRAPRCSVVLTIAQTDTAAPLKNGNDAMKIGSALPFCYPHDLHIKIFLENVVKAAVLRAGAHPTQPETQ